MKIKTKVLNVNNTRQSYSYDCGVIALQTVFAYYDVETIESELMEELDPDKTSGTSEYNLISVSEKYGFKVISGRMDFDTLKKFVEFGYPVIVLVQAWSEKIMTLEDWKREWECGHYVIVIGFDGDIVIFEDPASFKRTWMNRDEFMARWHSYDGDDIKFYNWGMVLHGKKPRKTILEHME